MPASTVFWYAPLPPDESIVPMKLAWLLKIITIMLTTRPAVAIRIRTVIRRTAYRVPNAHTIVSRVSMPTANRKLTLWWVFEKYVPHRTSLGESVTVPITDSAGESASVPAPHERITAPVHAEIAWARLPPSASQGGSTRVLMV